MRLLEGWLAAPGGAAAVLAAGHWTAAARTLSQRVADAAGVPLRTAAPVLAVSGTAWTFTLVLLGRHVGPWVASMAQWVPFVVLLLIVGAVLLLGRLAEDHNRATTPGAGRPTTPTGPADEPAR